MWIVRLALRRPFTVAAFCLVVMLLGALSAGTMPIDIFPSIDIPVVVVIWNYPGLSAEEMEARVTFLSERGMSSAVSGITRIDSQSIDGTAVLRVYFERGADIGSAISQVVSVSSTVLRTMPPGIQPPVVLQYNASNVTVAQLTLSGTASEQQLFDWGLNFLRLRLFTIPGLSTPAPYGGKQRQVVVDVDQARAQAHGVSPQSIVSALLSQNVILPAGSARFGDRDYDVLVNGSPPNIEEFNKLPIAAVNGATVYLGDVAHVYDGFLTQTNVVRVDGRRAAYLAILRKQNASTLAVVDTTRELLPTLQAIAPKGVEIKMAFDQSVFVRAAISGVLREGAIAASLVAIMVLLFVGSWRSTLVVAISIPLAILVGIIGLKLTGQTLNLMTLGGLSLVIGMLVDDATVEIENINRNRNEGKEILVAILSGARQVALPALAATLSICVVFFPVVLLTGPAKFLFSPLSLAVVFSMLASYLLSRTLVPTLSSMLLAKERPEDERVCQEELNPHPTLYERLDCKRRHAFDRLAGWYAALLGAAMAHRKLVLALAATFIAASIALVGYVGLDFFPSVDAGLLRFHLRAPSGSRIEQTERVVDAVEQDIRRTVGNDQIDVIDDNIGVPVYYNLGFVSTENATEADAEVTVGLKPKHSNILKMMDRIRHRVRDDFPGSTLYFEQADVVGQVLNFGLPAPIDVQVQARQYQDALPYALRLERDIAEIPGATDTRWGQVFDHPSLMVDVDRERAIQVGLHETDVASSLLTMLSSSTLFAPNFWVNPQNDVNYNVIVEAPYFKISDVPTLMSVPLTPAVTQLQAPMAPTGFAPPTQLTPPPVTPIAAYLGSISDIHPIVTRASIHHESVQPTIDVECNVQGRDLGAVSSDVQAAVGRLGKLPPGVQVVVAGQSQTMATAFGRLGLGMILAVILVYLLLVVLFQSWIDPLLILFAVPASLSGVLWMLSATRTTLNVESLMGAIMAIGIASSNSILLVHFANDRRLEDASVDPVAAALHAGRTRFRPVLMTALAMILGMLPMALGLGEGGEQNAPLGRAVIGGLLVSTFATLLVIPCAYALLRKRRPSIGRRDREIEKADQPPAHEAHGPAGAET